MRLLKKIYLIFLLGFCTIFGLVLLLLYTNMGMYLVCTGITYCVPGLTFNSAYGNWKNLNLTDIRYHTDVGIIKVDICNMSLDLKHIWDKKVYLNHLFLKNVCVQLHMINSEIMKIFQGDNSTINVYSILPMSCSVFVKNTAISNVCVMLKDNNVITLQTVDIDELIFQNNTLTVSPVYVEGIVLNVVAPLSDSRMITRFIYMFLNSNKLNVFQGLFNELFKVLSNYNVSSNIILKGIMAKNCYVFNGYDSCQKINHFFLEASFQDKVGKIKLDIDLPYRRLNVSGHVLFSEYCQIDMVVDYIVEHKCVHVNNNLDQLRISRNKLIITGELLNELCVNYKFLDASSTLCCVMNIKMMELDIPVNISVIGSNIPISFLGYDEYLVKEISLCAEGNLCSYDIQMFLQLSNKFLGLAYITINASWDLSDCYFVSELNLRILDGYLNLKGRVNWKDIINCRYVCTLNKFNNFLFKFCKVPMELFGKISVEGFFYADMWKIIVSDMKINGSVIQNKDWSPKITSLLHNNDVIFGDQSLFTSDIWIWKTSILTYIQKIIAYDVIFIKCKKILFKILDCNIVLPGFSGNMYGKLKLYNYFTMQPMRLLSEISIRDLYWPKKDIKINRLTINNNICCGNITESTIVLKANKMQYGSLLLDRLIVKGSGYVNNHKDYLNLYVSFNGNMLSGKIKFCGEFNPKCQVWSGKINRTHIITPIGTWKLMKDITVTYDNFDQSIVISSHYWKNTNFNISGSKGLKLDFVEKVNVVMKNFNLIPLQVVLPEIIEMRVMHLYCINCQWIVGNCVPQGEIILSGTELNIRSSNKLQCVPVTINNVIIKVMSTGTVLYCKWFIDNTVDNQNHGEFIITLCHDTPKFLGNIQIKNCLLTPMLCSFFQFQDVVDGLLNVDIHFRGDIYSTNIYGVVKCENLNVNYCNYNSMIRNGSVLIQFFGDFALLDGMININNDQIKLNGNIINLNSIYNMNMNIKIYGDKINFYISPEMQVQISPNIMCLIDRDKIYITGNIAVPWAYLEVLHVSQNIVEVSSEEVLLDDTFKVILNDNSKKNMLIPIIADLTLNVGDDVSFIGFGLNVKLQGDLGIKYNQDNLKLTGHVNIMSGYFKVYGQHLIVKKGQLLFSGAINQPYLDIEAIRNDSSLFNNDITAGLRITGSLDQPKLEIFSNVLSLSQQEVISYLLVGNKNNLILFDNDNTDLITSLLVGVSVKHSEKFFNKIGKVLGVQEFTINSQSIGPTSLVMFSGYITSKLQVKYNISVFDLLNTIIVRYRLCPYLYLEATSSGYNNSSFDLLYQLNS